MARKMSTALNKYSYCLKIFTQENQPLTSPADQIIMGNEAEEPRDITRKRKRERAPALKEIDTIKKIKSPLQNKNFPRVFKKVKM